MPQLTDKELAHAQRLLNQQNAQAGVLAGVAAMAVSVAAWAGAYTLYPVITLALILMIGGGIGMAVRAAGQGHSKRFGAIGGICTACALLIGVVEFGFYPKGMVLFPLILAIGGITAGFQASRRTLDETHRRMLWKAVHIHGLQAQGKRNDPRRLKLLLGCVAGGTVLLLAALAGGRAWIAHSEQAQQDAAFGYIFGSDEFAEHAREKGREWGMTMTESQCRTEANRRFGRCNDNEICEQQNPYVLEGCLELALPDAMAPSGTDSP